MLKRWAVFTRFLDDGHICLTNNAAERGLRGIALGRKFWLFAGSDRGGQRAAVMYSLIVSAKMNDIDPQAWLAHVLGNIAQHPAGRVDELLPRNWQASDAATRKAARSALRCSPNGYWRPAPPRGCPRRVAQNQAADPRGYRGNQSGLYQSAMKAEMERLDVRKTELEQLLANADAPPPLLHPNLA